jgi:hypothetical protein
MMALKAKIDRYDYSACARRNQHKRTHHGCEFSVTLSTHHTSSPNERR